MQSSTRGAVPAREMETREPVAKSQSKEAEPAIQTEVSEPVPPLVLPGTLDDVPRVSVEEVEGMLDAGQQATIIDVREKSRFDSLHIAGALSIPVAEIEDRLDELPQGSLLVTY